MRCIKRGDAFFGSKGAMATGKHYVEKIKATKKNFLNPDPKE